MCRMLAYLGPSVALGRVILAPPHNLIEQARSPRELRYTRVNADGFGFAWFDARGRAALYRHTVPIWADANLEPLARTLHAGLWLAAVRAATGGLPICVSNTQPFARDGWAFLHNGFIRDFATGVRPILHCHLAPEIQAGIDGNTDSEYLFALFRDLERRMPEDTAPERLRRMVALLEDWCGDRACMLGLIVSDGRRIHALRHGLNEPGPSMYYCEHHPALGGRLVASEPLEDEGWWKPLPEGCVMTMNREGPLEFLPLQD